MSERVPLQLLFRSHCRTPIPSGADGERSTSIAPAWPTSGGCRASGAGVRRHRRGTLSPPPRQRAGGRPSALRRRPTLKTGSTPAPSPSPPTASVSSPSSISSRAGGTPSLGQITSAVSGLISPRAPTIRARAGLRPGPVAPKESGYTCEEAFFTSSSRASVVRVPFDDDSDP